MGRLGLGSNDLGPLFMPLTLLVSENWVSRKLVNRAALGPLSWFLLGQITYLPNACRE